ncbi:MAG: PAS-domain containing protein [Methyloceanibacter sp.]
MRINRGEAAPLARWSQALRLFLLIAAFPRAAQAETMLPLGGQYDIRMLLTLGITLGIIAFSVGAAIACLRATKAAIRERDAAELEAERYRASESMLESILSAEPQTLLTWTEDEGPRVHVTNLPATLGVPTEPHRLLRFAEWLDEASAAELTAAMRALADRGEAFNLMLGTRRQRHVEVDGRTVGGMISLKVRDLAGQRLELAGLNAEHGKLDQEIAALRALLDAQASAGERRKAETRPSVDNRFRSFDRLATAFAVFDADQRLAHFNQAYVDLWQLEAKWLSTRPRDGEILDRLRQARSLPEKADFREWKRNWLAAYGDNTQKEDQWHLPDGRTLHVIADSAAEAGVTYIYENVTERLALESRYNALIHVQSETLDTLREGVAVFAANGRLQLHNRAFASIWRLTPLELSGEPHIDEVIARCRPLYDEPKEWESTKSAITSIVAERRAYESQFDRPDGTCIACAGLPLPDGGTLLTYSDITDTKRAERALIERNEALETADRLKSAFVSHVSYELRTPLTNIIGFSELLASPTTGVLGDKQHEYLIDIRASGQTLLAIIDDILDLATIDAGTFELKLTSVKARGVIDAAVMGLRERLKQNGIELGVEVEAGIDEFVADGPRITQILYNLLSNAIGFSPAGGKVLLTCRREDGMIVFTVEDEGCGIPEEFQSAVFERFESRSNGSGHRGAGLGLSIVKSLVELHGGTVMLASTPGNGTQIRAVLPLGPGSGTAEAEPEWRRYGSSRAG